MIWKLLAAVRHLVCGAVSDDGPGHVTASVPHGIQHGSVDARPGHARLRRSGGLCARDGQDGVLACNDGTGWWFLAIASSLEGVGVYIFVRLSQCGWRVIHLHSLV